MKIIEVEQNTPEWYAARIGRFTASNMDKIISSTGKKSTQVEKYVTKMLGEIVTGQPEEGYTNKHMERGKTMEQEACDYYAMLRQVDPKKVGFCITDDGIMGCSPDRFVGEDGILEIKTCIPSIMIEQWEKTNPKGALEQDHRPQTQCTLHIVPRKWIDTMLYCPGMKPLIVRSERNTPFLMDMVRYTMEAHTSLTARRLALQNKGYVEETADADPGKYLRAG